MAKIITRAEKLSRYPPPTNGATIGIATNTRKIAIGSTSAEKERDGIGTNDVADGISTRLRGKQPRGPNIEHDRHQQVDRHGAERRTDSERRRRTHDQAQDVDGERAPERVDKSDQQGGDKGAADRADAANDDDNEGQDQDRVAHSRIDREDRRHHDA